MKNITTLIKNISEDKRLTPDTISQAKRLKRYIGNDRPIPVSLSKEILKNKSKSDSVETLKTYIKNKS